ncbi:hypothetical protein QFC21_005066 [Naganishia friedmannii]|uniref:Uncharacterized protein n=1 Tax=Naganishia friedmannii TaxID=89922 RepID=A0ACC2VCZ9_9TREE|nr:hypothetical protein QFC21_005066 [Naganishia friedmannii]
MTVTSGLEADQGRPAIQPPSIASLSAMHQSTITTLVDLFNLALTHPSGSSSEASASAREELEQAREKIRLLEAELTAVKAHQVKNAVSQKMENFNSEFLKQGAAGGKFLYLHFRHEAAKLLLSSLPAFIASTGPPELAKHAARLAKNAVVNVIVNKFGLAGAVVKAGIVSSFSTVADFFLAFSQAHSNINGTSAIPTTSHLANRSFPSLASQVIDSGPGKEASDSKIHAQLHFYSSLPSCGLTILAGSHDAGYGNVLRSLVTEGRNVVLLRGGHTAWLLEGICPAGEIEGLFMRGKVPTLSGVGGAVGTGMPSPAPLGGAGRPVMVNGRRTEEARLQEIESARDKKRMRRRLRRQEERERRSAEENERNDKALQNSDDDHDGEEDGTDDEPVPFELPEATDDDLWQDTDGSVADIDGDGDRDDPADILARQFAGVRIRNPQEQRMMAMANGDVSSSSLVTPSKPPQQARSGATTATKARVAQDDAQGKSTRKTPATRKVETESDSSSDDEDRPISRPTPRQSATNKTPQPPLPRPKPQSWDALLNTPAGKSVGGGAGKTKQTPRPGVGMMPKTPGRYAANADRGEENSIPVQGAERALRYLNPRPCHK